MPNTIPYPSVVSQISTNNRRIHFGVGVDNLSRATIDFNTREIKGINGLVIMGWASGKMVGDGSGLTGVSGGGPVDDPFIDAIIFG